MFSIAHAQEGIVPSCADGRAYDCQLADFMELVNRGLDFLIILAVIIAVILVVYAGFLLLTDQGNQSNREKASKTIWAALIGLVITLAAYLVVNTVLELLTGAGFDEREIGRASVPDVDPVLPAIRVTGPVDLDGDGVVDATVVRPGGASGGSCEEVTSGACTPAALASAFGAAAAQASQICNGESGGNPASLSTTDYLNGSRVAFSVGLFQINLTQHELRGCGPGGSTLRCREAFQGSDYSARIVDRPLYDQCVAAAQNASCNISNAARIHQARGSWRDWTNTANRCNLRDW